MPQRYIKCEHCPTYFKTPFSKRKYCSVCQIIRDYEVRPHSFGYKAKECAQCHGEFYPAKLSWDRCPGCTILVSQPSRYRECLLCHEHIKTAPGVKNTCVRCVQSSAERREEYIKLLYRLREDLIAENPPPPPDFPTPVS